jgi:hypothetical protein
LPGFVIHRGTWWVWSRPPRNSALPSVSAHVQAQPATADRLLSDLPMPRYVVSVPTMWVHPEPTYFDHKARATDSTVDTVVTLEELLEQIRTLPLSLASVEHGADEDHAADDVAAAVAELAVAANIARVAQESLKMRVEIARSRGATWTTVGRAVGLTPWRAQQRYFEKRPFGARW